MPVTFNCANCGQKLRVPEHFAGKRVKCPKCAAAAAVPPTAPTPVKVSVEEPVASELPVDAMFGAKPEEHTPARRGPSKQAIKAGLVGGAVIGIFVVGIFSLVDYFIGGRREGMPGLVALLLGSAVLGAFLGAAIGLVLAFTRSLIACMSISAVILIGLKLLVAHMLGVRGGTALVAVSGAIGGAILGYVIAKNIASSVSWEE